MPEFADERLKGAGDGLGS